MTLQDKIREFKQTKASDAYITTNNEVCFVDDRGNSKIEFFICDNGRILYDKYESDNGRRQTMTFRKAKMLGLE